MSRTKNSLKNVRFELFCYMVDIFISFCARKVFVQMLTREYLGLNGTFSSVLSMLSLAELGIGSAITYSLYKPLAERDQEQIAALMALYRRAYRVIGVTIGLLGAVLTPFLPLLIRDLPDIPHIYEIYLLFVLNTSLSYFFVYKKSLIIADQRQYIATLSQTVINIMQQLAQMLFLWLTGNYFVYLVLQIGATLIKNLTISHIANTLYPYAGSGQVNLLKPETKDTITRNTKAMIAHKIGGVVVFGTDNLLISFFDGVVSVGLYSNYIMITKSLSSLYSKAFTSLTASVGNLGATEDREKALKVFWRLNFLGSWLYGFSAVCLTVLINPFIQLWLGTDYLFEQWFVCLIVLNFYLTGMRQATLVFRSAYGVHWHDRYRPLAEAAVNLVASILFAVRFGIAGILLGTVVSTLTTCFWLEPKVLFQHGLKSSVRPYFKEYAVNTVVTLLTAVVVWNICGLISGDGLLWFIIKAAVCAVAGNLGYLLAYHRREEFRYFVELLAGMLNRAK